MGPSAPGVYYFVITSRGASKLCGVNSYSENILFGAQPSRTACLLTFILTLYVSCTQKTVSCFQLPQSTVLSTMHLRDLLLAASALLRAAAFEPKISAAVFEPKDKDFAGHGQIRTLYIGRGHDDLGCLTSAGKWTADDAQCGTFASERIGNSTFHLSVPEGGCGVDVATFKCGASVEAAIFGVRSRFLCPPRLRA